MSSPLSGPRPTVTVRDAVVDDAPLIAEFNAAMALETEGRPLEPQRLLAGVQAVFDHPARGRYLIAMHADRPVGQLLLTYEWSDWRNACFWWIQSVYVVRDARGQGVYRALHEHVLATAKASPDVCGIRLYVDKANQAAQSVYRALAMTPTHYDFYELDWVIGAHTG